MPLQKRYVKSREVSKVTFRLPKGLLEAAHAKARRADVPISQYLRHCLREWVSDDLPEPEEQELADK